MTLGTDDGETLILLVWDSMGLLLPGPGLLPTAASLGLCCPGTWSTIITHLTEWETKTLSVRPPAQGPQAGEKTYQEGVYSGSLT